jgi:hypothetical protein
MRVSDLVAERSAPFVAPHAEIGVIIKDLGDKQFLVLWDDGIKRKFAEWEMLMISTTWSIINDFK